MQSIDNITWQKYQPDIRAMKDEIHKLGVNTEVLPASPAVSAWEEVITPVLAARPSSTEDTDFARIPVAEQDLWIIHTGHNLVVEGDEEPVVQIRHRSVAAMPGRAPQALFHHANQSNQAEGVHVSHQP